MYAGAALYCAAVNSYPCSANADFSPDATLVPIADGALISR
jgi:hypothetical protein